MPARGPPNPRFPAFVGTDFRSGAGLREGFGPSQVERFAPDVLSTAV